MSVHAAPGGVPRRLRTRAAAARRNGSGACSRRCGCSAAVGWTDCLSPAGRHANAVGRRLLLHDRVLGARARGATRARTRSISDGARCRATCATVKVFTDWLRDQLAALTDGADGRKRRRGRCAR